jgi:transposase
LRPTRKGSHSQISSGQAHALRLGKHRCQLRRSSFAVRRHHRVFFKAEAVGACQQPGVSIASVALARGLNANLLRRWVHEAERGDAPIAIRSSRSNTVSEGAGGFVPVSLASSPTECMIQIELRNGAKRVSLRWPASQARECALLPRALMK